MKMRLGMKTLSDMATISGNVLKHVLRRHRDFARVLGVGSVEELRRVIVDVVEVPDEVYVDLFDIKYFLKKINELYVNVIVVNDRVKTAYLIGSKTYHRLRERKWVRRP